MGQNLFDGEALAWIFYHHGGKQLFELG